MISVKKYLSKLGVSQEMELLIVKQAIAQGMEVRKLGNVYLMKENDIMEFSEKVTDDETIKNKISNVHERMIDFIKSSRDGVTKSMIINRFQNIKKWEIENLLKEIKANKKIVPTSGRPKTIYTIE
jgi:hypothetical protein